MRSSFGRDAPPPPLRRRNSLGEEPGPLPPIPPGPKEPRRNSLGFERWRVGFRPWSKRDPLAGTPLGPTRIACSNPTNPRREGTSVGVDVRSVPTCDRVHFDAVGSKRWRRRPRRSSPRQSPRKHSCSTTKEEKRTKTEDNRSKTPKEGGSSQDWKPNTNERHWQTDPTDCKLNRAKDLRRT
eukprot:scaffold2044_cov305-Pavlova_lutheri.AAC.11